MNGFRGLPEKDATQILLGLLEEAENDFEYERRTKEHPSIPALTRYFYKKAKGLHTEAGSTSSSSWKQNALPSKQMVKDMKKATIKVENPSFVKLKRAMKIMMDGVKKGSMKVATALVEVSKQRAAGKDPAWLQKSIENFEALLQEIRDYVAATEMGVKAEDDEARAT